MDYFWEIINEFSDKIGMLFQLYPIPAKLIALILYILALILFVGFAIRKIKDDINDTLGMIVVIFSFILAVFILGLAFNVIVDLFQIVMELL